MMVPAAKAVVVSANSSININTNIGSTAKIGSGLRVKLGLGNGVNSSGNIGVNGGIGGSNNNSNNSSVNIGINGGVGVGSNGNSTMGSVVVSVGEKISNFMVQEISYTNMTVSGLLYTLYPLASNVGVSTTLHINGTVGYSCDNSNYILASINSNATAVFTKIQNNASATGKCPL